MKLNTQSISLIHTITKRALDVCIYFKVIRGESTSMSNQVKQEKEEQSRKQNLDIKTVCKALVTETVRHCCRS